MLISKRYREKYLGKRKKAINKSDYGRTSLKKLFIERYGRNLSKTKDDVTHAEHKKRMICVDCINYKRGKIRNCPGWDKCIYKEKILKVINKSNEK